MDPNLLAILLGLVTNGLTSLIAGATKNAGQLLIGKEFWEQWEQEKNNVELILKSVVQEVASVAKWNGKTREEIVALFLLSPEVEDLVRQIYSTRVGIKGGKAHTFQSIRKLFQKLFVSYAQAYPLQTPAQDDLESVDALFYDLLKRCYLALQHAVNTNGTPSAHEALSAFRHNIIQSELNALDGKVKFLIDQKGLNSPRLDIPAILDFGEKYRSQVGKRHQYITPPNFDNERQVPINDLYIYPHFAKSSHENEMQKILDIQDFLSHTHRAVLLGSPGGGKSTFTQKLCYDLATSNASQQIIRTGLIPILVVLRKFGTEKRKHRRSIRSFIEKEVAATYQLPLPPGDTFEYLFVNGYAMVIFDGLDELLDTNDRQEIRDDVQSFCALYPSVPVLVTSRSVGYEQAPLGLDMFEVFHLEPFDTDQVKEYANKWFTMVDARPQQKASSFLKESSSVADLRSNPLMLALMCNIYRGENYIPRNRPDVYEKCATMLFDRWDRKRDIIVPLPFEAHIHPLMMYLAHWLYTTKELLTGGVQEKSLIEKATSYLLQRRFEDRDEAEQAAKSFIEFCRGRAWVFTDTGTERDGTRLYQFTHQTFLEYFTAEYFIRTNETTESLLQLLHPKIAKREWDVVAQLIFQIKNKNSEHAGDILLSRLIQEAAQYQEEEKYNILSFVARCLNFIIPKPSVVKDAGSACVTVLIDWGMSHENDLNGCMHFPRPLFEIWRALLSVAVENRETIANVIEQMFTEAIRQTNTRAAYIVAELITVTFYPFSGLGFPPEENEIDEFWSKKLDQVLDICRDQIPILCSTSFFLCYTLVIKEKIEIKHLIEGYGVPSIYRDEISDIFGSSSYKSFAHSLIYGVVSTFLPDVLMSERLLRELGKSLLSYPKPWIKKDECRKLLKKSLDLILPTISPVKEVMYSDKDACFGLITLLAPLFELHYLSAQDSYDLMKKIKLSQYPFYRLTRHIFSALFEFKPGFQTAKVIEEMNNLDLSSEQRHFIWNWIRRTNCLIEQH